ISGDLSWNTHFESVYNYAYRKLCFMRRSSRGTNSDIRTNVYITLARPTLEYASIIWDPHAQTQINKVKRIQRLATRFIFPKYDRPESVPALLREARLSFLEPRRRIARLRFLYLLYFKYPHNDTQNYIRSGRWSRRLNNELSVDPFMPNIDIFKYPLLVKPIEEWSRLPS
ncbi:uncharacterized protein LOC115316644, partial [Ixodes scapularis]|uniref:uncharacterized protein LOC115316644 n=1 Tax=Ixodes scapularis TaxID=6945 RepID=UPI001C388CB9